MNADRWDTLTKRAIVVTCAAAAVLAGLGPLAPRVELALLAAAVVAGLPHGATDLDVARARWPSAARWGVVAMYLASIAAVVAVWSLSPDVALAVFLAASAWHFGAGDARRRPGGLASATRATARGVLLLALPIASSAGEVAGVFAALGADRLAATVADGRVATIVVAVAAVGYTSSAWRRASGVDLAADVVLFAWLAWASPLVGFALYFAVWHSPRHLLRLDLARVPTSRVRTLALTAASVVGVVAAALWLVPRVDDVSTAAVRSLFVALAALTMPHMLLVETSLGREARRS